LLDPVALHAALPQLPQKRAKKLREKRSGKVGPFVCKMIAIIFADPTKRNLQKAIYHITKKVGLFAFTFKTSANVRQNFSGQKVSRIVNALTLCHAFQSTALQQEKKQG